MFKVIFPILVFITVVVLFKKNKLDADITGVIILILSLFLLLSTNTSLLFILAGILEINYVPLSIIAVCIALLLCLCICLAVLLNDIRKRQAELVRKIAELELVRQFQGII